MTKQFIKRFAIFIYLVLLLLLCTASYFYIDITAFINTPASDSDQQQLFIIKPGSSLTTIARNLEQAQLITSQSYFKIFVRSKKSSKSIQAGEYLLSASQSPAQVLKTLRQGKVKLYRLTLPEGLSIRETALAVEKADLCNRDEFETLCRDKTFIQTLEIKAITLEGYLYPDTYFFPKHADCEMVIKTLTDRFKKIITLEWQKRAAELGFSIHEIVTLASIIEKETGDASERPLISSVFHNRLKKSMRLESDPTVIYGIKDFDGNIKKKHLKELTPYNTYQIKGLPPGPIANPGALAIEAALYPVKSDYLFFVSKKDTTHKFSRTIQEHNRAVQKYQLRRK
jgi:UPF0755 protein